MLKLLRVLTHKLFWVAVVVLVELALLIYLAYNITINYAIVYVVLFVISFLVLIHVVNRNDNPYYRLAWTIVVLGIPPFGAVLYLLFSGKKVPKGLRERLEDVYDEEEYLNQDEVLEEFVETDSEWSRLVNYIESETHFPVYKNTDAIYLESGEKKFSLLIEKIKQAQDFIFLEYFIIKDGELWEEIYQILSLKVSQGVDVRLIYDDWGCSLFPQLKKQCKDAGIKCFAFNPLVPRLAIQMNNRNHRKIAIIDGKYGFVGGMNIADEYVNIGSKYGHWKDTAVMIEGEAVHSLTLMFLQFYSFYSGIEENPNDFIYDFGNEYGSLDYYVMPFADAPTDNVNAGADAHISMINNAKKYVYIQTPYLIIGYEMTQALCLAAQSGVDVKIITPGIPDKKIVNEVTKSNYDELVRSGVKIYEYQPGFVHSKTLVSDDEACIVGTTNMDFRSYYLHFETSILFLGGPVIDAAYEDIINTLELSKEITVKDLDAISLPRRLFRNFAKLFSGLM